MVIGKLYDMADNGAWVESQPLLGIIDEFYIFDKALSEPEIKSINQVCNFHRVVLHFGFEKTQGIYTLDQSGLGNNGKLVNLTAGPMNGICGLAMNMSRGEIDLDGQRFKGKPLNAISIATWVKLNTNRLGSVKTLKHIRPYFPPPTKSTHQPTKHPPILTHPLFHPPTYPPTIHSYRHKFFR